MDKTTPDMDNWMKGVRALLIELFQRTAWHDSNSPKKAEALVERVLRFPQFHFKDFERLFVEGEAKKVEL